MVLGRILGSGGSRCPPLLLLIFFLGTGGLSFLCGPAGHFFFIYGGFGSVAQGGHHVQEGLRPAPAVALLPAPFVCSALSFSATTASLAAPFLALLHLLDQSCALVKRMAVFPAIDAVGASGGWVLITVVQVGVLRSPGIAGWVWSAVLPNPFAPLIVSVILTHVLC